MAASAISHEEYFRLQTQLLDLRAANYTLMEESNRFRNEARNAVAKLETVEKAYQKAQQVLDKSRKAKDVEMLFVENEALQNKLMSQEEQFREQNQALLQELAVLVAANEKLEAAVKNPHQQDQQKEAVITSEQDCQCDLFTEFHERLLNEEKQTVDNLRLELQGKNDHIEELNTRMASLKQSSQLEIECLKEKISTLQSEVDVITSLRKQLEHVSSEKSNALVEISELKQTICDMEELFRKDMQLLRETHQADLDNLIALHSEEVKQYEIQVELASAQRTEFEEEAAKARQEREDALEDVRIAERRRMTDTADLRRQLRGERRRADKLQERLRDFISGDCDVSASLPNKADNSVEHDNCSVSSWSLMSGQNETGTNAPATPSSPFPSTDSPSSGSDKNGTRSEVLDPPDLANENARLVARLATMQQEKWRLEERVLHLEETNAAMADEMLNRGKLIQHYCMEGRRLSSAKSENGGSSSYPNSSGEKLSVRRVVNLIRHIGGEGEGDADSQQRRLQRMLEETLTKNMHLQEDIERLSQEVVRLSQIVGSSNVSSTQVPGVLADGSGSS